MGSKLHSVLVFGQWSKSNKNRVEKGEWRGGISCTMRLGSLGIIYSGEDMKEGRELSCVYISGSSLQAERIVCAKALRQALAEGI